MLQSVYEQYDGIFNVLVGRNETNLLAALLGKIDELVHLLRPFKEATELLIFSDRPTIHLVALLFGKVIEHLTTSTSHKHADVIALQKHILVVARNKLVTDLAHRIAVFFESSHETYAHADRNRKN